jgi:DNA-directed RNA polymerase subunit RPC12/RpoP
LAVEISRRGATIDRTLCTIRKFISESGASERDMSSSELENVVYCPECGGVVGATVASEAGQPCKCFEGLPRKKAAPVEEATMEQADAPADDASPSAAPGDASSVQPKPQKICILCGKDVSGHRRLKDSRGYRCLECAKKEELANKVQGVRCPRCGRTVKEETIAELNGERMCQRCLREQRELTRPGSKRFRKIDDQHFERSHKKQVIVLSVIALVLAFFIVLSLLKS